MVAVFILYVYSSIEFVISRRQIGRHYCKRQYKRQFKRQFLQQWEHSLFVPTEPNPLLFSILILSGQHWYGLFYLFYVSKAICKWDIRIHFAAVTFWIGQNILKGGLS